MCATGDPVPAHQALDKIDDSKEATCQAVGLETWRVTVAKEFAAPALFEKARERPHLVAAIALAKEACACILRTKAGAVYPDDVTALVTIRADQVSQLTGPAREPGVFLTKHLMKKERTRDLKPD